MTETQIDRHVLALWQLVIDQIQPREIGSSLKEFCQLIEFDPIAKTACIYVEYKPVVKVIAAELNKIEQAFATVLRDEISISLSSPEEAKRQPRVVVPKISEMDLDDGAPPAAYEVPETNQGLGASHQWNGLNFRSKSEIKIAQALDERGVLYFPNARGRLSINYNRVNREADFLVCHEGRWGILECDGQPYHQSAADDHARDMLWNSNGIWFIKRFASNDCYNNAAKVVDLFLEMLRLFDAQTRGSSK